MRVKIFETTENDPGELNKFLAQDSKTVFIDKFFTAAAATEYTTRHYVTVVYHTIEQAPEQS